MKLQFRVAALGTALTAAVVTTLATTIAPAQAQNYPVKPIRMIIPFAAGGNTDIIGRIFLPKMGEILGQQIII
ncbi:MAG: tripartite tricarboxylate transporter substrate binding protein, partial [Burkholderiales bacterium]|nr:tripartite tricarboxylate transporter substrate binding protein [Burkholderiales bacterium]